ncbi:MAG: hypothetical protein ACODAJ_03090 [Planctomycetota bacterium]
MAGTEVDFAKLSEEQLEAVRRLEAELGVVLLAYTQPLMPAELTDEQLAALKATEDAMPGVCLVAYHASE